MLKTTKTAGRVMRITAAAGALLAVAVASGCGINTSGTQATGTATGGKDVQYVYGIVEFPKSGSLCSSPIAIALEKGYFKEEGIDAKLVTADTETRKIGLDTGRFAVTNGDFQFFPSIEQGVKASVVGALHKGCIKIAVKKGSKIKTAADLKGKKIGVDEIGGTPYMAANMWLGKAGLNVDQKNGDVQYLPFDDANLEFEALQNGQIDAAALWDPLPTIQQEKGTVDIIFDLGKNPEFAKHFCCFLYGSNKVISENPKKMSAILRALNKARNFIDEHPEEAAQIILDKKYSTITDKQLAVNLLKQYDYAVQPNEASLINTDVQYFVNGLQKIGFLDTNDPAGLSKQIYKKVEQ